jgi:hypothetical protein
MYISKMGSVKKREEKTINKNLKNKQSQEVKQPGERGWLVVNGMNPSGFQASFGGRGDCVLGWES